jgi:hypothetical protein
MAGCGDAGVGSTTTIEGGTTGASDSVVSTTTTIPTTTGTEATTTTTTSSPGETVWTVDRYGRTPDVALGSTPALGSGCAPGTDYLPDGVWFGWIADVGNDAIEFDLACLWPGRLEPAASNDSGRARTVPVTDDALLYLSTGTVPFADWSGDTTEISNAPGLPDTVPYWVFVNDGAATEIAKYPGPVVWAQSADAWPGLVPGCCDGGDEAPPSPEDPLPPSGYPVDGFYKALAQDDGEYGDWPTAHGAGTYDIEISKWLSCDEYPELCPEWWVGDEVTGYPDEPTLNLTLDLDEELTVVIMPIITQRPIVGDGTVFDELLADLNSSVDTWVRPGVELRERSDDPSFPFGDVYWPGEPEWGELGYRGPGGAHLTWFGNWLALEMRDGRPILYIHAGLIAG